MLKLTTAGLEKDMKRHPSRNGGKWFKMLEAFWNNYGVEGMEQELGLTAPSSVTEFVRAAQLFAESVKRTSGTR